MRIVGERSDGVLHVKLATGLAVLVDPATTYVSKAIDESEADAYGPWQDTDNSLDRRRQVQRVLDRGKHQPVRMFSTPLHLRDIPQAARDQMPSKDFAGPHESFPIAKPEDVSAAAHLVGHAADPAAVRARIIAIAHKKGDAFVAHLPDDWKKQ